ncbi:hypothetical protein K474DRAFT_1604894 [Panus rudis PR-1116 ss-1]|nr:hypothetical protein K474DRAFT_1604894 [Panus rudis PR-1116 ss-1]
MDDDLERPTVNIQPTPEDDRPENDDLSSGEEDDGPDWTKLPCPNPSRSTAARPVIPKRGEKDFEPIVQGGSGFQRHVLDRARSAMLNALRAPRNTSSKGISYGVWYPDIARVHVTTARGTHLASMGHSVARQSLHEGTSQSKAPKRLELLPEEAIYLIERGAMFCWKTLDPALLQFPHSEGVEGAPMTVQQAFAEMIGRDDLSLEKYQVYSYLRRLGYVVTRTKPPTFAYPLAAPFPKPHRPPPSLFRLLSSIFNRVLGMFSRGINWWQPVQHNPWWHLNMSYASVFKSLRFIPSGHETPLKYTENLHESSTSSPYQIFFNVYKPSTPFKKTAPPAPDFSVVVVNARTTPMPTLEELSNLFDVLPELPPPVPRKRLAFAEQKELKKQALEATSVALSAPPEDPRMSFLRRLFSWAFPEPSSPASQEPPPRKPNPFAVLKAGKKLVVIAAVDAGTTSFFGFRQGVFEEFPMA